METPAVQANFIPKQGAGGSSIKKGSYNNLFFFIAVGIFILALFAWGGLLVYEYFLEEERQALETELSQKVAANVDRGLVDELKELDDKLVAAETLLDNHVNPALLFGLIEQDTLTTSVRYSSFSYSVEEGELVVSLSGEAKSFASLGYQKTVLEQDERIISPEIGSFNINEEAGLIEFDLTYRVDKGVVSFGQNL